MCSHKQAWALVIVGCLAAAGWGCRNEEPSGNPGQPDGQTGSQEQGSSAAAVHPPSKADPPQPEVVPAPTIPKVAMTAELLATCLVRVGDVMPDAKLPDLADKPLSLSELRGRKLTVVCLWRSGETDAGRLKAHEVLADLQDLYDAEQEKGLRVVGINEGDPPEAVRKLVAETKVTFPNLCDADRAFFNKVATERFLRVYLLDAKGEILWFDVEFSPTTRRNLTTAIQAALGGV
jgi:peroxiredoxin